MSKKKQRVTYIDRGEPAFIAEMKRKAGLNYQEPTIESKNIEENHEPDSDDDEETGDLAPSVVVLKRGDLGEEEFKKLRDEEKAKKDAEKVADGKMTYRNATKRSSEKTEKEENAKRKKEEKSVKNDAKAHKNTNLLSFGDDEEEDG
ncbi:DgyrCDS13269 [Dimorphilus gyrociliatus]|uniref:DgyrCDS13269 n=1 Tax=Dimorphilus gyrociliatus TaxID=2664684 RepID=A0A7I8WA77_9ANNE|nr:DgyrCDS13269 [Dimorphilus gyrociliatus]